MFYEHTVTLPPDRKKQGLYCLLYLVVNLAFLLLGLLLHKLSSGSAAYLVVLGLLLTIPLYRVTWKRTKVAHEYSIEGDLFTYAIIYGNTARREIFSLPASRLSAVEQYDTDRGRRALERYAPERQFFALASRNEEDFSGEGAPEVWFCLFEDEKRRRTAFYFEMTGKAYRLLKRLNPPAVAPRAEREPEDRDESSGD